MKIVSQFFDKENWSLYATLQTIVILSIMKLGKIHINKLNILVFASLLAMMRGDLLPKLIYTFFMCLLVWGNKKQFVKLSIITIISVLIIHFIKKNNKIYQFLIQNKITKIVLIVSIILWMIYIPYLLIKNIS